MERWTRRIIHHRRKVVLAWFVLLVVGGLGTGNLSHLLSNRFSVPGSEAERGRRYIVNVGSVGQPRDRDPRAAYAVWDVEAGHVEIRRVSYDVTAARRKIVDAGLPRFLADRLAAGA